MNIDELLYFVYMDEEEKKQKQEEINAELKLLYYEEMFTQDQKKR